MQQQTSPSANYRKQREKSVESVKASTLAAGRPEKHFSGSSELRKTKTSLCRKPRRWWRACCYPTDSTSSARPARLSWTAAPRWTRRPGCRWGLLPSACPRSGCCRSGPRRRPAGPTAPTRHFPPPRFPTRSSSGPSWKVMFLLEKRMSQWIMNVFFFTPLAILCWSASDSNYCIFIVHL